MPPHEQATDIDSSTALFILETDFFVLGIGLITLGACLGTDSVIDMSNSELLASGLDCSLELLSEKNFRLFCHRLIFGFLVYLRLVGGFCAGRVDFPLSLSSYSGRVFWARFSVM